MVDGVSPPNHDWIREKVSGSNTDGTISEFGYITADEVLKSLPDIKEGLLLTPALARELMALAVDQAQKALY